MIEQFVNTNEFIEIPVRVLRHVQCLLVESEG